MDGNFYVFRKGDELSLLCTDHGNAVLLFSSPSAAERFQTEKGRDLEEWPVQALSPPEWIGLLRQMLLKGIGYIAIDPTGAAGRCQILPTLHMLTELEGLGNGSPPDKRDRAALPTKRASTALTSQENTFRCCRLQVSSTVSNRSTNRLPSADCVPNDPRNRRRNRQSVSH